MKKITSIALVFVLILCIAPSVVFAETFTLRNGICFGDSYDTVKNKEKLPFNEQDDSVLEDGTRQVFAEGTVAGIDECEVMFRFNTSDRLNEMKYSWTFVKSKDDIEQDYSTIYDGLKRKYGTPLNYTGGSVHLITTNAIESAIMLTALFNALGIDADYMDYNEWIVDTDDGDHVKIDMISYYTGNDADRSYHLNVGYLFFTDQDLEQKVSEKAESLAEIDGDL